MRMRIGDKIDFGDYEWRVLAIEGDKALVVTEYIIGSSPYHNVYKDVTWAECSLREYLNGEFYDGFGMTEQARVVPVTNENLDNQWYGTKGGVDTTDRVFLLSVEEVCKYFGDSLSKLYNPGKNQRYWFERKDENNSKRIASFRGDDWGSWWWLRSPGRVGVKAVYIWGTDGNIGMQGNNVLKGNIGDGKCIGGVRPALWLKL